MGRHRWAVGIVVLALGVLGPDTAGASVTTYPADPQGVPATPLQIAPAPDGSVWFARQNGLGQITTSGQVRHVSLPGLLGKGRSVAVAADRDGSVWATESTGLVAHVIPGVQHPVEVRSPDFIDQASVLPEPDGTLWIVDPGLESVQRFAPATGAFSEMRLPVVGGPDERWDPPGPSQLVRGPDGAVWFLELVVGRVGRIAPDGSVQTLQLPAGLDADPTGIAAGRDGAFWIAEAGVNRIARLTLDGQVREFAIPSLGAEPRGITVAADGALWFTEMATDRIGRLDPATGAMSEYALPAGSGPYGIALGGDGALWCTLSTSDRIARITTDTPPIVRRATRGRTGERAGSRRRRRAHRPRSRRPAHG